MAEKKFLTTKEVSDRTGIPAGTLNNYAWKKQGIPFFKVNRRRFYEVTAVDAYMKANPVLTSDSILRGARSTTPPSRKGHVNALVDKGA